METTRKLSRREKLSLIGKYLRPCWGHFAAALLCACLAMVFNALTPQIIRITVDSILGPETPKLPGFLMSWLNWAALEAQPLRALWWAAAAVLLTALLRGVCSYGQRLQLARGSEGYVKGIRDDLYRHIQYLPFAWHKNNPTGDIIQRCTSDVERIKTFFEEQFVSVFRAVAMIVFALVCMALMNWKLALVPAVMFPIIIVYSLLFHNSIRERYTACDVAEGVLSTIAQENLTGVRVVRAFGRERFETDRFCEKNEIDNVFRHTEHYSPEYFTNSFHVNVTEEISPFEKQDREFTDFHLCEGGHIQYIRLDNPENLAAVRAFVERGMEKGFYQGVNFDSAYCGDCGRHSTNVLFTCPHCGSRNLSVISRVCGYLGYSNVNGVSRMNDGKMAEIKNRKSM